MADETDAVGPNRRLADQAPLPLVREFPPLLNIEHQELIRAVERAQVNITANREILEARIQLLDDKLNERHLMQTKALDAAFAAQQTAMTTALTAAEKAVSSALASAEKAVDKAENASEKRFEGVNEFRGQLSDIISTMMPRAESMALVKGLEDKIGDMKSTLDKGFSGLDASQNTSRWITGDNRASTGVYIAIGGVALTVLIVVIAFMNLVTGTP